jgi:hypothetical protein
LNNRPHPRCSDLFVYSVYRIAKSLLGLIVGFGLHVAYLNQAMGHGEAVLCDNRESLLDQCGGAHECVTDESIDSFIGYCRAEAEEITFQLCDRSSDEIVCMIGEICKIGTIDPQIGVCMSLSLSPIGEEASIGNMGSEDMEAEDIESEGCQMTSSDSPLSEIIALFSLLIFGLLLRVDGRERS